MTNSDGNPVPVTELFFMKITIFIMCMAGVLFGSNYMGIQKHFFMMNHPNRYVKVVAGVIWDIMQIDVLM